MAGRTGFSAAWKPDRLWDIHKPVGRRSMLLAAAGAIIGLTLAGYGLFTAQGTRTAAVPAEDAALAALVDGPDTVIVEWIKRSTTLQGHVFENAGITVAEFRDGKLVAMRDYLDTYYLSLHFDKKGSKRGGRVQAA